MQISFDWLMQWALSSHLLFFLPRSSLEPPHMLFLWHLSAKRELKVRLNLPKSFNIAQEFCVYNISNTVIFYIYSTSLFCRNRKLRFTNSLKNRSWDQGSDQRIGDRGTGTTKQGWHGFCPFCDPIMRVSHPWVSQCVMLSVPFCV